MEGTIVWIRFISLILVPCLLVTTYFLPSLLTNYRSHVLILSGVSAIAVILARQGMLPNSIPNDIFLFTIPVFDGAAFLLLSSLFRFLSGRYPLAFHEIQGQRRSKYGERYTFDHLFWFSNILIAIFIGFAICALFKLGIPTKSGMINFD
jgi:hypothetical protein